ncbi:MAG: exonuclease subunit SbcD [Clostridia bacterium]|nr:exonuclease subunit SbcD [Clostridia bacterium]MBQ8446472.1 exonuclease subunit SbcD [Clostridia bacterium]
MKILHTSDWHIGKRLINRERLDEQTEVLDEIVEICDREGVELVIIAGDVFDTYTPSAEAERLFYSKIKLVAGENRAVVIVSGNHDDGVRLSAAAPLSQEQGIYIIGNERRMFAFGDTVRPVRPIASGKGYATFVNEKGEKVFLSFLPYPNEARFKEEKSELPYVEQMQKWIEEGESGNVDKLPSVFVGHLFVAGGAVSDSEREIDLGGARAIPVESLPKSDYIALGHLHKKQHMGKGHCYYSGSPLQYAFDERADKGVKVFDLTADGVQDLHDVPLTKGKKLVRLQADDVESALTLLQAYPDELVEMKLILTAPLVASDAQALSANKNLVSLIAEVRTEENLAFESRKGLSSESLFDLFYKTNYGAEPKEELKTLFLQTLTELDET